MWPRTSTDPSDGVMIPASVWSRVLLPAPFGPITASDSPWTRRNVTSRRAQNVRSPSPPWSIVLSVCRSVLRFVRRRL